MTNYQPASLLTDADGPAAHVLNAEGRGTVVLACEHASNFIPTALGSLGLDEDALVSHAAWDIGALDVARHMMTALDAPLVASRVSRLVYDCNRPPEAPDAITEKSERFDIPGNRALTAEARDVRVREVYRPFQQAMANTLAARTGPVLLVTIHSFTPVYMGKTRQVELGLLHDADDRVANLMLQIASDHTSMRVEMNQPYSAADGVTHTLREHAVPAGIPNVMIEIRSDFIDTPEGVERVAGELVAMLFAAMKKMKLQDGAG
ncbi:Predicted N-formylglutamate amidohydrolase [Aliiruegeria lutimaris]|uniref:Predicted N-formylglutamate amidohydrolase n=2 Tax=Aliiruegeria lutimaris TaxID=571298 RepID=A0A1G9JDC8_9RHOB|nr:Predicted N-formylglutamate amidohydrolase [Aliiruegeria lutimaris]